MANTPPSPLFVQVAETLKARINNRTYKPGSPMPSARELEQELGVSNITIRKAMELLSSAGLVLPRRGARAVVADAQDKVREIEITSDYQHWAKVKAEVIDRVELDCPELLQDVLKVKSGQRIERIRRIRKLTGDSVSYYINYGPLGTFSNLPSQEIVKTSMVTTYQSYTGGAIDNVEQRLHAVTADMDLASILNVDFGFPLFFIENVYYKSDQTPLFVTHMYYRADRFVYTIKRNFTHPPDQVGR
jgi:GntR family transcriptional regulator